MISNKRPRKPRKRTRGLADELDVVSRRSEKPTKAKGGKRTSMNVDESGVTRSGKTKVVKDNCEGVNDPCLDALFERWDGIEFDPSDFTIEVPIDSLESGVGYSSLFRQMHRAFVQRVAFFRSPVGGSMSIDEARAEAFHACTNPAEAKKEFAAMMRLPLEKLDFVDLLELHALAPRVAERLWEIAKREGGKEFESGHLAANMTFPVAYMKGLWNIARYLGVRESFIAEWQPNGGIEIAMIDMLTQCYFQWQYWLEQTVKRSETREREMHPEYAKWLAVRGKEAKVCSWDDGHWLRPYVSEQEAIEHAVQMADRFHRMFMRTLRQMRDLRRYANVTITNANQVNIAGDGGQQVNVAESISTSQRLHCGQE